MKKLQVTADFTQEERKQLKDLLTVQMAFFVIMGGFTIRIPELKSGKGIKSELPALIDRHTTVIKDDNYVETKFTATLTLRGFVELFSNDHDRRMFLTPEKLRKLKHDIKDRAKSGAFAKCLSSLQAIWLVGQSIGRAKAGIPLR